MSNEIEWEPSAEQVAALRAAAERVEIAWNELSRCTDEFLPEYPDACGEYQSRLDDQVLALIAVLQQARPTPAGAEVARELRGALERAHAQAAVDQATAERWMNALGLMTRERDALLAEVVALRKGLQARPTPAGIVAYEDRIKRLTAAAEGARAALELSRERWCSPPDACRKCRQQQDAIAALTAALAPDAHQGEEGAR